MSAMTPGRASATVAALCSAAARKGTLRFFFHGATTAVRLPVSMLWRTQPSAPSLSRMRRHCSNSATISTGRPFLVKTQEIWWSLEGHAAHIDALGLEADEARQGQAVSLPRGHCGRRR
jgi:hypothetical protein